VKPDEEKGSKDGAVTAKLVGKMERRVRRDVLLVGAGAIIGLSVLATAVWMKR
jgi:hypothetical protein